MKRNIAYALCTEYISSIVIMSRLKKRPLQTPFYHTILFTMTVIDSNFITHVRWDRYRMVLLITCIVETISLLLYILLVS